MPAARNPSEAIERLRILARRDLPAFPGLAPGTKLDDVAAVFELDRSWHGQGPLGNECRRTDWFTASGRGFGQGVRVWADEDDVLLLDAAEVELPDAPAQILERLGEPDARLDSYLGTLQIERSEWVYARRGLTLYVNPASGALLRVAAFIPTELTAYRGALRLDLEIRHLPLQSVGGENP